MIFLTICTLRKVAVIFLVLLLLVELSLSPENCTPRFIMDYDFCFLTNEFSFFIVTENSIIKVTFSDYKSCICFF